MRLSIYELLKQAADQIDDADKVELLRKADCIPVRTLLHHTLNPAVEFALPEGEPPYKKVPFDDVEGRLYTEMRRVYLFTKGGHPTLKQRRREELFIQMLESVAVDDSRLLIAMKDHKMLPELEPLTKEIINAAFPGLIP